MYSEERKIHLIEEVSKVENEAVLLKLETVLNTYNSKNGKKPSIYDFVGIISKKEADEMKQAIAEACENIDMNDWK
jgi:hypothetical protein